MAAAAGDDPNLDAITTSLRDDGYADPRLSPSAPLDGTVAAILLQWGRRELGRAVEA